MTKKERLFWLSVTFAFLSVALIIFKSTIDQYENKYYDAFLMNIIFVALVIAAISFLTMASLTLDTYRKSLFLLLIISFFSVAIRIIPNLRLSSPPFNDSYTYIIGSQHITQYGTLTPQLSDWFPSVEYYLKWPILNLISSFIEQIAGFSNLMNLEFLAPLLSIIMIFSVFILAKQVTNSLNISALSALIAACVDATIFYQSEYHPQGLAVSFFFLAVAFTLKSVRNQKSSLIFISAILILILVLVHHFSAIFVALLGGIMLIAISLERLFAEPSEKKQISGENPDHRRKLSTILSSRWLMFILFGASYMMIIGFSAFETFLGKLVQSSSTTALLTIGSGVPLITSILSSYKWGLLIIALPALYYSIRSRKSMMIQVSFLTIAVLISIGVASFAIGGPADRLIAFAFPLIGIFSSMTIFLIIKQSKKSYSIWRRSIGIIATTFVILLCAMSVFNTAIPSLFFDGSGTDTHYYFSNDLTTISRYESMGTWVTEHIDNQTTLSVEFDTAMIAFYFSHHATDRTNYLNNPNSRWIGIVMINPSIPYTRAGVQVDNREIIESSGTSKLFDDGVLNLFIVE